ncbi:hypothetical protein [Nocardiopsis sp. FR26]|uniref:hypothetical protein n=1 Tax=Nocardiopsis sp. FR26 TaxID=2605987 RepID=UPI00135BA11D|nr:hypothetical protein [Nocardiopsis sp. FR26]
MPTLPDTEPALVDALNALGDTYGPLGVALAAAHLSDPKVVARRLTNPDEPTPPPLDGDAPAPTTTAALFTGYYRELVAGGMPRDLAKQLVATAATHDRHPHVHPAALAAANATRERALASAPEPVKTPVRKRAPKPKGMGPHPSARERRGPLIDLNIQGTPHPARSARRVGEALSDAMLRERW